MSSAVPAQFLACLPFESLLAILFGFDILTHVYLCSSHNLPRKHGILPPLLRPPRTPSPLLPPSSQLFLSTKITDAMEALLLEAEDSETQHFILAFRKQRFNDLNQEERKGQFGSVLPISRAEYNRGATEASMVDDQGEDEDEDVEIISSGRECFTSCTAGVRRITTPPPGS